MGFSKEELNRYKTKDNFISEKNRQIDRIIKDSTISIKYYESKIKFYSDISNEDFLHHLRAEGKKLDIFIGHELLLSEDERMHVYLYRIIEKIKKRFQDWRIQSDLKDYINELTSNHRETLIKYPELVRKIGEAKSLLEKEYRSIAKIYDILNSKPNRIRELLTPNTAPPSKTKAVDTPITGGKNKTRRQKKMKGKQSKNKTKNNTSKKSYSKMRK